MILSPLLKLLRDSAFTLALTFCLAASAAERGNPDPIAPQEAKPPHPEAIGTLRHQARGLLLDGDYQGSIAMYRSIVDRTPMDAQSHYDLAAALSFLRFYVDAVEPIREAIRLRPDYVEAHKVAAIIYLHLGQVSAALAPTLRAAELGDTASMYELVWFYTAGKGIDVDEQAAFLWVERAANHNHVAAMDLMTDIYRNGLYGQEVDPNKSAQWAERAYRARQ
ncbi:MAG: hypothetical protein ACE5LB_14710 [Acidiferrobacterales bacterium]